MSSSIQYSLMAGMRAVNQWQQYLLKNASGLLQNGYNKQAVRFGGTGGGVGQGSLAPTLNTGGRAGGGASADTLTISSGGIIFEQGELQPHPSPTQLAIKGNGFFLVAENLRPGARTFLTRAGDFRFDQQGRLVNSQGLFVVGGSGNLTDPPQTVNRRFDGTIDLTEITLGRVTSPNNLMISGYGSTIYQLTPAAGPLVGLPNGNVDVGFVQPNTLEFPNRTGTMNEIAIETNQAQQTYKMLKEMLDSFNRMADDSIGLIR